MPRALIAGCGYLGRALASLLTAEGWEVEGWMRSVESAHQLSQSGYCAHNVDISNSENVLAHKSDFDFVVHCASTRGGGVDQYRRVYRDGARNLVEYFDKARVLFVSSTSVYAQTNGQSVTEESPAQPKPETGKILREAENLVISKNGTVIRLGGIYGPGRSALLKKFLDGRALIDPENDRFVNAIHRDDGAMAISILLKSPLAVGQIYNVVDDMPTLVSECYRWLAAALHRPLPPSGKSTSRRKRGESNKRVSNAKLRSIGWIPQFPDFATGMEKSVLPALVRENV
jgi:nucleoside-diphosphate-sugar epimerase